MTHKRDGIGSSGKQTRRAFIKTSAVGAAGVALGAAAGCSSAAEAGHEAVPKASLPAGKSKVIIVRDKDVLGANGVVNEKKIDEMLEQALIELSGESDAAAAWAKYFKPDDVVGVKMNLMMNATSPEVTRGIVRGIMKVGVKENDIIVWDRDEAGRGLKGATVREEKLGFDSKALSRVVTDKATALVNVPGMKAHWLAGVAVAVKNWIGAVTKLNIADIGVAYAIHGDSCAECASVNAIPAIRDKCRLVIADGLHPLYHGGPRVNPKYKWPYSGLIISEDPVAVDAVCIKLLEIKRREFKGEDWPISPPPKHVYLAETKYKLGHSKLENIEIVKLGWQEEAMI